MSDQMKDQLPLFDAPASPMRRTTPAPRSSTTQYRRITAKRGRLCDDCPRDRYPLGPLPRQAIWRRTDDTTSMVLCQLHKEERRTRETR